MIIPDSFVAASQAITTFMIAKSADLPAANREAIIEAMAQPSPVDTIMRTLEALYAARDDLDDSGRTLTGQLAGFVIPFGFHGINDDNRGLRILQAMQRDTGEEPLPGTDWAAREDDPAPGGVWAPAREMPADA